MDLNFPVFATGERIFRASNDVGPLFLGPGSTRIHNMWQNGEIKVHRSSACGISHTKNNIQLTNKQLVWKSLLLLSNTSKDRVGKAPELCAWTIYF